MQTVDVSRLELSEGDHVLDVGCSEGEGNHLQAAYEQCSVHSVGVDSSVERLKTFQTRFVEYPARPPSCNRRWNLSGADLLELPFDSETFDAVICAEVLEHIPDYRGALRELKRVLRSGGHLAVSVPRFVPEWICWVLEENYHDTPGGHLRIFRYHQLCREIENLGFQYEESHSALGLHTPYWWLQCLIWDQRDSSWVLKKYNDFLVWDLMEKPPVTRILDALLNPIFGKSQVLYFSKRIHSDRPSGQP